VPRYDYACDVCGHRFEATHSITDDALSVCPECGGSLRRVIGAVGVAFKGSGFYRTDSRAAAKSRATSGKSSGGSAAGKSAGLASSSTPTDTPSTAPAPSATAPAAPPTKPSSDS
jgi:putative FmdB family regulatory protein